MEYYVSIAMSGARGACSISEVPSKVIKFQEEDTTFTRMWWEALLRISRLHQENPSGGALVVCGRVPKNVLGTLSKIKNGSSLKGVRNRDLIDRLGNSLNEAVFHVGETKISREMTKAARKRLSQPPTAPTTTTPIPTPTPTTTAQTDAPTATTPATSTPPTTPKDTPTKIMIVGRRPQRLPGGFSEEAFSKHVGRLRKAIRILLEREGSIVGLSGMALGSEQAFAMACFAEGVPYIAVIPSKDQAKPWTEENKLRYKALLKRAEKIVLTSKGKFSKEALERRNQYLLSRTDKVLAYWEGRKEGATYDLLAKARGKPIMRVKPS